MSASSILPSALFHHFSHPPSPTPLGPFCPFSALPSLLAFFSVQLLEVQPSCVKWCNLQLECKSWLSGSLTSLCFKIF